LTGHAERLAKRLFSRSPVGDALDSASVLRRRLEQHISKHTGRRVQELAVEVHAGRVVVRGRTRSYYVKQLAQHGVRDLLPQVHLENAIRVQDAA
jgi:osmotically-inducible protein OsmY